jgi:hypothetical protein
MMIEASTSGDYSVVVTNEFGCTNTDALNLVVFQSPEKPVISSGPVTVDIYITTTSIYSCAENPNVSSYQWSVTPTAAGTTTSTGSSAEFTWTAGYTGSVLVTVMTMNECFTSELSETFATEIYSSVGLNEYSADVQLIIYPNPTDGKITISMPSQKAFTGDLTVTGAGGSQVYSVTGIKIPAGDVTTLDLGQLPEGIYSLKLSSKSGVYYGRVIMK